MSIYEIEKRGGKNEQNILLHANQHGGGKRKAKIHKTGEIHPGLL